MEQRKVGDTFEFGGVKLIVCHSVDCCSCEGCYFKEGGVDKLCYEEHVDNITGDCPSIIFKEIK